MERVAPSYRHRHEFFKVLSDMQEAGQQAEAAHAWPIALECYQQALRHWESLYSSDSDTPLESWRQRWELLLHQAGVSQRLGQWEDQRAALETAASEIAIWGDDGDQLQVVIPHLAYLRQVGDLEQCRAVAGEGLRLARALVDRLAEGECWQALGDCERDAANYVLALEHYEAALINFSQHKQTRSAAFCLIRIGSTYLMNNQFGRASACLQEAAAYARSETHPDALVPSLLALAYTYLFVGDLEKAYALNREALALSETASLRSALVPGLGRQGYLELLSGNPEGARQQIEQAWVLAQEIGHPQTLAEMHSYWGQLYLAQAEPQAALTHFEQAQALCSPGSPNLVIETLSYQALACLALEQTEPALTCSHQAMSRLHQRRDGLEAAQRIYFNHYRVLLAAGQPVEAQTALATARQMVLAQAADFKLAAFTAESTDTIRERFLTHLPWNREIMAASEMASLYHQEQPPS
jgi:tetratricopeptide (TPR) repeat protein